LNERQAKGIHYDGAMDVARVAVLDAPGTVRTRTVAATLLLDDAGFLAGIDVEPDAPGRTVVMLAGHEKVARRVPARVGVCTDQSGTIYEVRIASARAAIRGHEKNPYV
jgi:hypothetical protein